MIYEAKDQQAADILTAYMVEKNMRKTPERYAILDVIMAMDGHNTAEKILAAMPDNFRVSLGSIYNTLRLLVECGLVNCHYVEGAALYERAFGREPHSHYICTGCARIWDLNSSSINEAAAKTKTPKFKKLRSTTYIYGICNLCLAKLARMKKKMERERVANMTREEKRFAKIDEELQEAAKWFK